MDENTITEAEEREAQTLYGALTRWPASVEVAYLDGKDRVLVATVEHPDPPTGSGVIPVAIFITQDGESSLFDRVLPQQGVIRRNSDGTEYDQPDAESA